MGIKKVSNYEITNVGEVLGIEFNKYSMGINPVIDKGRVKEPHHRVYKMNNQQGVCISGRYGIINKIHYTMYTQFVHTTKLLIPGLYSSIPENISRFCSIILALPQHSRLVNQSCLWSNMAAIFMPLQARNNCQICKLRRFKF